MAEFGIPMPANESFRTKRGSTINSLMPSSSKILFPLEKIDLSREHGYLIYKKGLLKPSKGLVYPEAVKAINTAKKALMTILWFLKSKWSWGLIAVFALLPRKKKVVIIEKILSRYWSIVCHILEQHQLEHHYQVPTAKEVEKFVSVFLKVYGINDDISDKFASVVATIFEYDDAYRYRLQDICSETSAALLLADPIKEISRLLPIYQKREFQSERLFNDVKSVTLLRYVLKFNVRLRASFNAALRGIDFKGLQFDEIDHYNILMKGGYDFLGRDFDSRYKEFLDLHGGVQPEYQIID